MKQSDWPAVAVIGAGAVGCYFGGMLARAGAPVTLIGRERHMEAIAKDGLLLDTLQFKERVMVSTSTSLEAAGQADIVLFCVKTLDTGTVARQLSAHLPAGAVVISLQNGVDNAERIQAAAQLEAIPAVVYVAAAMTGPGQVKHSGRGDLILGGRRSKDAAAMFVRAGVPCRISENIAIDLWIKIIMNCTYNGISALTQKRYGPIAEMQGTRELMKRIVHECVAVAEGLGVSLSASDLVEAVLQLGSAMPGALSSTAQDILRGKATEIDSLNGYVVRRGQELGVDTPVNQTIHAMVKLLEERPVPG